MKRLPMEFLLIILVCFLPLGCVDSALVTPLTADRAFTFQKGEDEYSVYCKQLSNSIEYSITQVNTFPPITVNFPDSKVASCGLLKKALSAKANPLEGADLRRAKATVGADTVVYLLDQANLDVQTLDLTASSANAVDLPGAGNTQYPVDMAITPDGSTIWLIQLAVGQNNAGITPEPPLVSIFNTAQQAFTGSFTLPNGVSPNSIQFSADGTLAYITNDGSSAEGESGTPANSSVLVVNVATQTVTKTIPTPQGAGASALSPDGLLLYTVGSNNGYGAVSVTVIDTSTNTVATAAPLPDGAVSVSVNPTGTRLYVLWSRGIDVLDTATLQQVASIPAQNSSLGNFSYFSPDGTTAYICGCSYGPIYQIDIRTNQVINTIQGQPGGLMFGTP